MKKKLSNKLIVFCLISLLFVLVSCDRNKGKCEDIAKQFVMAFNEGDKATIFEVFPDFKKYDNLQMSGTIGENGEVHVEKDDSTGLYIATINEVKKQRLVLSVDSTGTITIIDTYGVFRLDSISNEIALKTGVPVKKLSDVEMAKLMNSESDFIYKLQKEIGTSQLIAFYGAYSWGGFPGRGKGVEMRFTVSNTSSQTVNGKDYYLLVTPKQLSTGRSFPQKTIDGQDIAPDEVREFTSFDGALFNYANNRDFTYTVEVKFRTESLLDYIHKYATFKGDEYEDYLAHPFRAKVLDQGEDYVVSAEKTGVAYVYNEKKKNSAIVDTLYHRQYVKVIWESEVWATLYNKDFQFVGYIYTDDVVKPDVLKPIMIEERLLKSEDGKPISVYSTRPDKDGAKVVMTYPNGTKVFVDVLELFDDPLLYTRQPNGSMKVIGHVKLENLSGGDDSEDGDEEVGESLPDFG